MERRPLDSGLAECLVKPDDSIAEYISNKLLLIGNTGIGMSMARELSKVARIHAEQVGISVESSADMIVSMVGNGQPPPPLKLAESLMKPFEKRIVPMPKHLWRRGRSTNYTPPKKKRKKK